MAGWRTWLVAVVVVAGGCSGAAESQDLPADLSMRSLMRDQPATPIDGPCALLSRADVERTLAVTIVSARERSEVAATRLLAFTLPDAVCEYYGVSSPWTAGRAQDAPLAARTSDAGRAAVPANERDDATPTPAAAERSAARAEVGARVRSLASRVQALEVSVGVSDAPVSRAAFDRRYERRAAAWSRDDDPAAVPATPLSDPRFVEQATDGAKDIGDIGDAARWYPAMAQLDVLVGDTAFAISDLRRAPLVAGKVLRVPAPPLDDPPQDLVDLARLAAARL